MEEQIAESVLLDVFDAIKGPFGKQRSFINIDDFKAAVLKYRPNSIVEAIDKRANGITGMNEFK